MAQWINLNRNNSFVNQMRLSLLCEKSGAILLVLVGLTGGRQSDERLVDLKKFKFAADRTVRIFTEFNKGTLLS